MTIQKVDNIEDAIKCDNLLTKLIKSEANYDKNLKKDYEVKKYFENLYKNKNNALFIAKDDKNNGIGYAYCKIITDDNGPQISQVALLDGLYVNEEYRKQGFATSLVQECKNWATIAGAKIFELNVISENQEALKLYENFNFIEFEKKMRLEL